MLSLAAVTSWCANLLANHLTNLTQSTSTASQIIPFLVSTTSFYSTESILISSLLATKQLSTKRIWQRNYLKSFPEPLTYSICGYAIFLGYKMLGLWATVPLFLFPTLWRHLALLRRLDLLKTHSSLIRAIAKTIDEKDRYTGGHSASVVEIATALAREMNLSERFVEDLEEAAIRHDLGKVSWPNQVLRKPERLNPHEEQTYKLTHPDLSAEIARRAGSSETVCQMIRYHHERWDGKGYPHRLKGNAIPLGARILCVADSFDAMIHDRWYRRKRTLQDAIDELIRCSATQFDPQVVDAFMRLVKRIDPEALVRTIEEEVSIAPVPATSEECIHAASSQYQETKPSHNDYIATSVPNSSSSNNSSNTHLATAPVGAPVSHQHLPNQTPDETPSDSGYSDASNSDTPTHATSQTSTQNTHVHAPHL